MRGFIGEMEIKRFINLFCLFLLLTVSYGVVFAEKNILFNDDFNTQKFSKGGPTSEIIDPTYSGIVVWNFNTQQKEDDIEKSFLTDASSPNTNIGTARDGVRQYKVQKGETLKGIASKFSLSIETIKSANPQIKNEVKRGDNITILPLNGILYDIQDGDTIHAIANRYEISENLIKQFNPSFITMFAESSGKIFLPYAKQKGDEIRAKDLKDVSQLLSLPAIGWNWGELHKENAVDIANKCGTNVVAAADGVVIKDIELGDGSSGWNNGYGIFILLEHANGIKTRYAHLEDIVVDIGDVVSRGQKIGTMGSTGNTETVNGCHVHFEVLGGKNPFTTK